MAARGRGPAPSPRTCRASAPPTPTPTLRGGFVGLGLRHDRGALARAVLEGVAYALRDAPGPHRRQPAGGPRAPASRAAARARSCGCRSWPRPGAAAGAHRVRGGRRLRRGAARRRGRAACSSDARDGGAGGRAAPPARSTPTPRGWRPTPPGARATRPSTPPSPGCRYERLRPHPPDRSRGAGHDRDRGVAAPLRARRAAPADLGAPVAGARRALRRRRRPGPRRRAWAIPPPAGCCTPPTAAR